MRQADVEQATRALLGARRAAPAPPGEPMARKPKPQPQLTHLGKGGEARMVDVSAKAATEREAVAEGRVVMTVKTLDLVLKGNAKKGDVLGAGAHRRHHGGEADPRADPALPSAADHQGRGRHRARPQAAGPGACSATVKVTGQTGVEMEALTAVSVACLTIYDMVKAVERGMRIEGIRLIEKTGGKSGHYRAKE